METALVSMLLVTLLFGIIESSFLFKDALSVSAASRAGARMGASQPRSVDFAKDSADQVANAISGLTPANIEALWVYQASSSTGLPDSGSFADCTVCVKYSWNLLSSSLVEDSNNWLGASQNACAGDPSRHSLGVYLKYRHSSPVGFFFSNTMISESTVMWIEPTTAPICKP